MINVVITEHVIVVEPFGNISLLSTSWGDISYSSTDWSDISPFSTSWNEVVNPLRNG